ncbi:MAG: N-acetylmuramoyl-L-alanine amidase [Bacteroidota bacterium]|nr:N-acetylmuramoyl-L-alanine amidase [Bacteroidota bacterium]
MKRVLLLFMVGFLQMQAQQTAPGFFFVKTIGPLAFLKYGLGEDRLGGAKQGFLDSNILLKVVDSNGISYRVQLSRNHSAWIEKQYTVRIPGKQPAPYHLTGSMRLRGARPFDTLSISVDERLPYRTQQQINPSRIVLDIYGATSNTNWITQLQTAKEVKNVYYEQVEDDLLRVYIDLKHAQHWGHTVYYDSLGRLQVLIKQQPPVLDIKKLRIAIDAGHGGDNLGASGLRSKALEKDYTLKIAKQVQARLKKAGVYQLFMTRSTDTTLEMPQRIQLLKYYQPDILVSIHLNSAGSDAVRGTSTYYRYIGFRPLSVAILKQMETLGLKEYGNVGNFNFSLNGPTAYPNCLVEVAFLSNAEDEKRILDPKFHAAVANKIYLGIRDWLAQLNK